jgi:type IV pilus assembly PilN-like protein
VIRTNLATRPFYNERIVNLWLLLLAVVVGGATIFNVTRARSDSGNNTELLSQATENVSRTNELRRTAAQLRASLDAKQIESISVDAREANNLIDRRTFSWTALFNRFETTLPDDVRIRSVRPQVDRDHKITLTISIVAKTVKDVDQFMSRLDETGAFKNLYSTEERPNEDNQIESELTMVYVPEAPK